MPLTKRQFELGLDEEGESLMRQVYDLLASHQELAYSLQELEDAFLGQAIPPGPKVGRFRRAVEVLVEIGAVDQREVAGVDYHAFLQDFDTNTWKSVKLPFPPFSPHPPVS